MRSLCKQFAMFFVLIASLAFLPAFAEELPHFFPPGMSTTQVPHEQWALYLEHLKATSSCHGPNENAAPIAAYDNIKIVRELYGKQVTFNFDLWRREKDGKIYYSTYCGRQAITDHEFEVASEWLIRNYKLAVDEDFAYYGDIETLIVKDKAAKGKKSEDDVRKDLEAIVPELSKLEPPVTFREFQQIPAAKFTPADFVQKEVHFTNAAYFGAVYLNGELVNLTIQAAIVDYLHGRPLVTMHELVHGNEKFQDMLFGNAIDVELMASIDMMLVPEDQVSVMFHSYAKEWREMIYVISGFNFAQAREEIIPFRFDGDNIYVDPAKFDMYAHKLDAIKAALLKHYHDTVLPELYGNKIYWAAVNTKLVDTRGVFRILLMKDFDPTILDGGHKPTMEWNDMHREEILAMAMKALKKSNGPDKDDSGSDSVGRRGYSRSSLELVMRLTGMNEEKLRTLAKKHKVDVARFAGASPDEVLSIILPILRAEMNARTEKE